MQIINFPIILTVIGKAVNASLEPECSLNFQKKTKLCQYKSFPYKISVGAIHELPQQNVRHTRTENKLLRSPLGLPVNGEKLIISPLPHKAWEGNTRTVHGEMINSCADRPAI